MLANSYTICSCPCIFEQFVFEILDVRCSLIPTEIVDRDIHLLPHQTRVSHFVPSYTSIPPDMANAEQQVLSNVLLI